MRAAMQVVTMSELNRIGLKFEFINGLF